jgi:glycosyltransferase involved in cell wall biosynthesis
MAHFVANYLRSPSMDAHNLKLIVGIPAYNEERTIADVVASALPYACEVVVADDGSTDLTAIRAYRAGARILRHTSNQGKGAAIATLFDYAVRSDADVLVLLDGDGQHDPGEIPAVSAPCIDGEADVVVGSRFLSLKSDVPLHRSIGQRAFNLMTSLASGVDCSDSQSGFRAFGRRAIRSMRLTELSFSVECEQQFECRIRRLRLTEVPISCKYGVPAKRSIVGQGWLVLSRLTAMTLSRRLLLQEPTVGKGPPGGTGAVWVTGDVFETSSVLPGD